MGSITATAQPDKGRVRLDIDWTSHPSGRCKVFRVVAGGTPALIREGSPCVLSHNKATIYDVEGPLDQPTIYRTTVQLNDNADMELTAEGWQAAPTAGATVTQSLNYYQAGNASLRIAPDGATAAPVVYSDQFPATVGVSYAVSAQLLSATAWKGGVGLIIRWETSGGALVSTTGTASNLWPANGMWEPYTLTGTAPATTGLARVGVVFANTPPVTNIFYLDEVYATTALGTVDSASVVLPSSQGGWWKDPLHPATMVRVFDREEAFRLYGQCGSFNGVALVGFSQPSRPSDSALLEVPGQSTGVAVFAHRKASRRTIVVTSGSPTLAESLRILHDEGGPLLLQLPAVYGLPEEYHLCASLDSSALGGNMTYPLTVHQTQVVHTLPPPGPGEGVLGARYQDFRKAGQPLTYAAANSAGLTWQDGLKGNIS